MGGTVLDHEHPQSYDHVYVGQMCNPGWKPGS